MLNRYQFGQNKVFRAFAYIIIIGFVILLFLPTSIGLRELFSGKTNDFIQVNAKEIFFKSFPLHHFEPRMSTPLSDIFKEILNPPKKNDGRQLPGLFKRFIVEQILDEWEHPMTNQNYETLRMMLKLMISRQMNLDLVNKIGLEINKKDLNHLVERGYKEYLTNQYESFIKKNPDTELGLSDFFNERYEYDWLPYQNFAQNNLANQYMHFTLASIQRLGTIIPEANMQKEIGYLKNQLQFSYILFNYQNYLDGEYFLGKVNKKKLKNYYKNLEREKIVANKISFASKEEANHAKTDASLFKPKSKKYKQERVQVQSTQAILFNQLQQFKVNEISNVLDNNTYNPSEKDDKSKNNRYAIYQILVKGKNFQKIVQNKTQYESLAREYANDHYKEFQKDYQNQGKQILRLASNAKSLRNLPNKYKQLKKLQVAKTKWFKLTDKNIFLEESKREKTDKETPISKELLNENANKLKQYNLPFFEIVYSSKKGSIHAVTSKSLTKPEQSIFIIMQKEGSKASGLENNSIQNMQYKWQLVRQSDYSIISELWINYLIHQLKFSLTFNKPNILRFLNINSNE